MRPALRPLCAALTFAGVCAVPAHAQSGPDFRFSGFGTISAVHSNNREADFTNSTVQPKGAGFTQETSFTPDSKLGLQLDAILNQRFSAVVQVVSQQQFDGTFNPDIEWANVKWRATDALSVRVGRIAAPTFMLSDTRLVGYAQPFVRPPVEVYGVYPVTRNDGFDMTYAAQLGATQHTAQFFWGKTATDVPQAKAKTDPGWGLNDTVQWGDLSMRAGYTSSRSKIDAPGADQLLGAYQGLAAVLPPPLNAEAARIAETYNGNGKKSEFFSFGASYDPGKYFLMGEFIQVHGSATQADARNWYAAGGWRLGNFTPYLVYASARSDTPVEPGIPLPALAPLNAGLQQLINNSVNGSQDTASIGVRWNFYRNMDLKAQYDHVQTRRNSAGRFENVQPGFVRGSSVDLVTVAFDFVF
jgi:hypothetical protein